MVAMADARSENPGESASRVRLIEAGIPVPELQYEVFDEDGRLVARTDFCWEEFKTLGEFDGKVKYGRLLNPGQDPGDVVFEEKVREDALRRLGWQVVRWIWADLARPEELAERVRRAFRRGLLSR